VANKRIRGLLLKFAQKFLKIAKKNQNCRELIEKLKKRIRGNWVLPSVKSFYRELLKKEFAVGGQNRPLVVFKVLYTSHKVKQASQVFDNKLLKVR